MKVSPTRERNGRENSRNDVELGIQVDPHSYVVGFIGLSVGCGRPCYVPLLKGEEEL